MPCTQEVQTCFQTSHNMLPDAQMLARAGRGLLQEIDDCAQPTGDQVPQPVRH